MVSRLRLRQLLVVVKSPALLNENRKAAKAGPRFIESMDVVRANVSRTAQHKQVLLMTCKVQILGQDGSTTQARALLDSASSKSFITERLTQQLGLKRKRVDINISGIGGSLSPLSPRGAVDFRITSLKSGRHFPVQAIVLCKVTSDLPSSPTPLIISGSIYRDWSLQILILEPWEQLICFLRQKSSAR